MARMKYDHYHRFDTLSPKNVFRAHTKYPNQNIVLDSGATVKNNSWRVNVYLHKGMKCRCGREGSYFAAEVHKNKMYNKWLGRGGDPVNAPRAHLNLYGRDPDGVEFMMTVDHIQPKSKGGSNELNNLTPMCDRCNGKKADKVEDG